MATTNTLFALIAVDRPEALEAKLPTLAGWLSMKVSEGQWLLIAPSSVTTKEVSEALGITGGETTAAIVLRVENYYGRASTEIWEWVAAKIGVPLEVPVA